jgi:hypothetical protein
MKQTRCIALVLAILLLVCSAAASRAAFLEDLSRNLGLSGTSTGGLDDSTIASGLKEALSTGTTRAVTSVSRQDGYFSNPLIKILLPEKIRTAADLLGKFGFQREVDDFVLSMNRAAEKAAPKATEHFVSALKAMTFDDARKILQGGNTSATDYFKRKTGDRIFASFKPVIAESMKDVGVAQSYGKMAESFNSIPFAGSLGAPDLDNYITTRAVDGLFTMLGEEEKKIRTDPMARGTELLRKVFGK